MSDGQPKLWTGLEVEGAWSGLRTLFVRGGASWCGPPAAGVEHVYLGAGGAPLAAPDWRAVQALAELVPVTVEVTPRCEPPGWAIASRRIRLLVSIRVPAALVLAAARGGVEVKLHDDDAALLALFQLRHSADYAYALDRAAPTERRSSR